MIGIVLTLLAQQHCPPVKVVQRHAVVQQVVKAEVIVAPAAVPYFSYRVEDPELTYLKRQNERLTANLTEEAAELRQENRRLRKRLDALLADDVPASRDATADVDRVLNRRCSTCHANGRSAGGFSVDRWTPADRQRAVAEIQSRRMPPPSAPQLSTEEKRIIAAYLERE